MPAICGIAYTDQYHAGQLLRPMLRTLAFRGSSDSDEISYKNIDLACCGTSLLSNKKKTIWCALDGHIFNKPELYKALNTGNLSTKDNISSEALIIQAYERWELECFDKIDGDYAFALLDENKDELIIARDRLGKKPLYWYHHNNQFLFASELKALLTTGAIPQTPSQEAIATYLFFGFFPQDVTPIEGINKLLPAHYLRLHLNHNKSISSYWSYSLLFNKDASHRADDKEQQLDSLLKKSLSSRLPHSKKAACFVSGGLGSAGVAHYLKQSGTECSSYSVGFKDTAEKDLESAKLVARTLALSHHSYSITPEDIISDLPKVIWHLDEPLADPYIVATWRLAANAAADYDTAFSGMGSDELVAGHSRFLKPEQTLSATDKLSLLLKPVIRTLFLKPLSLLSRDMTLRYLFHYPTNPLQARYLSDNALMPLAIARKASPALAHLFDPEIFLHRFYNIDKIGTNINATLYLDVKTRLADLYMLQYDRLTACHGIDWRSPFLDRSVVEFLAPLPRGGYSLKKGSSLLKSIFLNIYPSNLLNRKKQKRPNFMCDWLSNPDIRQIFTPLRSGTLVGNGIINPEWIDRLLASNGRPPCTNPFRHLWSILCLELWFRLFVDNPATETPPTDSIKEIFRI